jgi:hypothetical protein
MPLEVQIDLPVRAYERRYRVSALRHVLSVAKAGCALHGASASRVRRAATLGIV